MASRAGGHSPTQHPHACPQFKCGLLQQLADLTMKQNDERSATLRALLDSESMLDAEAPGGAGTGGAGDGCGDLSDGDSSLS